MKPRSPLTEIDSNQLASIWGIHVASLGKWRKRGLPHATIRRNYRPLVRHIYNLYSIVGWLRNSLARHSTYPVIADPSILKEKLRLTEEAIATYKSTHTMPEQAPTQKKSPAPAAKPASAPPKPFRQYPADRRMLTGDSVWTQLFFGRSNGLIPEQLNRTAIVTKDEDNFGCVLVRFDGEENTHSIPVCNLLLIRAVEDIPVLSIISDQFAFYITTKSVQEAIAAFWYGGKTGRLRDDARALAELNLELLKKENA